MSIFQSGELRDFLRVEVLGFVEHQSVAVAQDIRREPAVQAETAGADDRSKARLHERLTRLEVLTRNRHPHTFRQFPHGRDIHSGVRCAHDERCPFGEGSIGIAHGGGDTRAIVGLHGGFEVAEMIMDSRLDRHIDLRTANASDLPSHDRP